MNITEKSFILVEEPTGTIIVDAQLEKLLRKEMRPILWFRKGLSCVVPVEVLKNTLNHIDHFKKSYSKPPLCTIEIDWKQAWPITDSRAVAVLSGLDY